MTTPALQVRELTVTIGGTAVVDRVCFDAHAGRTLAVVGESGSGKSLSALALMGLLPPGAGVGGSALLAGPPARELVGLAPSEHRKVRGRHLAMVFQEPMTALNPVLSVGEQVIEAFELHGTVSGSAARDAAAAALTAVGVQDAAARLGDFPHQFSGGMRQRVLIAMALAGNPGVLIADEVTTALDASLRTQVLGLITSLREARGMAVVLISHDLPLVAGYADTVCVMYAGRVVEAGPVRSVFASPLHPYTRCLLECLPSAGTRGARLATVSERMDGAALRPIGGRTPWWPTTGGYAGLTAVEGGRALALAV